MKNQFLSILIAYVICPLALNAITVNMNTVSQTMNLKNKATGEIVDTGEPEGRAYSFTAPAGIYILSGIGRDGKTYNGSIELEINTQEDVFDILTETFYVTNKTDGMAWTQDNGDYSVEIKVCSREGIDHVISPGFSVSPGRYTFLALNGDSYYINFIPSFRHQQEGYGTMHKNGTLTGCINIGATITELADYSVIIPKGAQILLGEKSVHFTDYNYFQPISSVLEGNNQKITYKLVTGLVYNYRIFKEGALTQAGYFTLSTDPDKRPQLVITDNDLYSIDPGAVNHSVKANNGFETGDIFLNLNKEGFLQLDLGETFGLHCMRSWQLTDNSTNNYFIEPDFYFEVLDLNGKPTDKIVTFTSQPGSPWVDMKGIGKGTAIVLVTYRGIRLNFFSGKEKKEYMGGEYWGGIWPENTGVFVVNVGGDKAKISPEFLINEDYNKDALKLAGKYLDAEHDVFYYLENKPGFSYSFKAPGATKVEIAYPAIEKEISYIGFTSEGIKTIGTDKYSALLKEGRQIIRMTDQVGNSTFQVVTAKKCNYEITNLTEPGREMFSPGDEVEIQFSGLRHPANKLAGIYNMSAYICYNGLPNGTSLILSGNQYTFGSDEDAQLVKITLPEDWNTEKEPSFNLTNGVIQVNGYGDPIGNHRNISRTAGRSPNFTAVPHKTYFGAIPDIKLYGVPFDGSQDEEGDGNTSKVSLNPENIPLQAEYYNSQGLKSGMPFKGLNLVRTEKGEWKKVFF